MENMNDGVGKALGHKRLGTVVFLAVLFLATFLFMKTLAEIKAYGYIGGGVSSSNTITVSGTGDAFAAPDIATFSFSVSEEDETVAKAQDTATKKMNVAIALLRKAGIEDKDIQTTGYNIYPQYDYIRSVCNEYSCPPGRQELRGYQVSQTVSVKVRNIKDAGKILSDIGSVGVSNVSGLTFTIDDEEGPQREARQKAIDDARAKATELANDLGVRLVRVIGFSENNGGYPTVRFDAAVAMDEAAGGKGGAVAPEVPTGENKITSNVNITYEIR